MNVEWDGRFSHTDGTRHDVEEYAKPSLEDWLIIPPPYPLFHALPHNCSLYLSSLPSVRKCLWKIELFANGTISIIFNLKAIHYKSKQTFMLPKWLVRFYNFM